MLIVGVYNAQGTQVGELELNKAVFGAEVKENLLFEVSQMLLNNRRQGTASTKGRSEVRGGGRKPWRQKGTGRARHGSIRSPLWKGGGVVFGPKPRSYRYLLPKKMRRTAMRSALTSKLQQEQLIILDELKFEKPRTREIVQVLKNLGVGGKALLVTEGPDVNLYKSSRNIPGVKTVASGQVNVLDILQHERLILTKEAVARIEEVFAS
jgi:large subunit ribosomal protein L4